jgi:hypothetical protein
MIAKNMTDKTANLNMYYELIIAVLDYNITNKIKPMIDIYDKTTLNKDPTNH